MSHKKQVTNKAKEEMQAAAIIFNVIKRYKPTFYDIFGYDLSGKRKKLLDSIVDNPHDKVIDKYFGNDLKEMKVCRRKGRIYQEYMFGQLVNKVLNDLHLKLESKRLQNEVHQSVLKIAEASRLDTHVNNRRAH